MAGRPDSSSTGWGVQQWLLGLMVVAVLAAIAVQIVHTMRHMLTSANKYTEVEDVEEASETDTELMPLARPVAARSGTGDTRQNTV